MRVLNPVICSNSTATWLTRRDLMTQENTNGSVHKMASTNF